MGLDKEVSDILYERLRSAVYHFPGLIEKVVHGQLSEDPLYVITKVFERVLQKTGKRVVVVIDTNSSKKSSTDIDQSSAENYSPIAIARRFVTEVKYLVSDLGIMYCLFASSEGRCFRVVARREHRLQLFQIIQLPKSIAEEYVSDKIGPMPKEVSGLLKQIPLTFSDLDTFTTKWKRDKEAAKLFVRLSQKNLKADIERSCSHPNAKMLYEIILTQGYVPSHDIIPLIPLQEFEKLFVSSNILCFDQEAQYVFQFAATRNAAATYLGIKVV